MGANLRMGGYLGQPTYYANNVVKTLIIFIICDYYPTSTHND